MKTATFSKKLIRKKVLVPARIIGVGILLSVAFIVPSPLENTWAEATTMGNQ